VIVGVRPDGTKDLVWISDGIRESAESWTDVLRDLCRRGMAAPTVAVGDGALGFWAALRDVLPETVEARGCADFGNRVEHVLRSLVHPDSQRGQTYRQVDQERCRPADAGSDDPAQHQALYLDHRPPFSRLSEILGPSGQTIARRYRRLTDAHCFG
jgi:hypothetical protein